MKKSMLLGMTLAVGDLDRDRLVAGEGDDDAGADLSSVPGLVLSHVLLSWLYSAAAALSAAI